SRGTLRYLVIRKIGSEPTAPGDGTLVGETAALTLTDNDAPPGEVLYYAVYAQRGGAASLRGAVIGPVVRTAEVKGLKATAGDGKVAVEWQAPSGTRSIEIWRQTDVEPRRRGDGQRVSAVTLQQATDTGLSNGVVHGYRVIVVFDGADGKPLYSD